MPADLASEAPLNQRQRFELRQCEAGPLIVTAYEKRRPKPSLVFDTGRGYPGYLAHAGSVLVLQIPGGSSDHVYVFMFQSGKPSVALKTATNAYIQAKQLEKTVVVVVPPKTYPMRTENFRRNHPRRNTLSHLNIEHLTSSTAIPPS
ncbi:MAG: hypothetical protein HYX25_08950 [Candidatus Solibacter usitatus]|nr:hypothetical protein [Candidatus Solibacter usitatus]